MIDGGTGVNAIAARASATVEWRSTDANAALAAGIPAVALGCCEGENMHAPNERIRSDSIATGASQLCAVLQEVLELTPRAARN
jgi:di/tripeptidase